MLAFGNYFETKFTCGGVTPIRAIECARQSVASHSPFILTFVTISRLRAAALMLLPLPPTTTMQLAVMSAAPSVGLTELFGLATVATLAAVQPVLEARSMPVRVARSPQPSYHAEDEAEDEDHLCYPLETTLACETCELSDEWSDFYGQPIWMCSA